MLLNHRYAIIAIHIFIGKLRYIISSYSVVKIVSALRITRLHKPSDLPSAVVDVAHKIVVFVFAFVQFYYNIFSHKKQFF